MVDWSSVAVRAYLMDWSRAARQSSVQAAIIAVLVAFSVSASLAAEVAAPSEYELKAVFIYNFIKFTEWPPAKLGRSDEPFIIGILGKDPFGGALDKVVEGDTLYDKRVVVRRYARVDDVVASHALFISFSEEQSIAAVLKRLEAQGASILTIGETENFAKRGGVIGLQKENKKVVFGINLIAANRAGLNISAQLLKIAKDVVK
jgi:uncharacterized protein DUF4154